MEAGISVQTYNGDLLYEPWEIYDEKGNAFTAFNAYWDTCLKMQMEPVSHLPPWRLVPAAGRFQYWIVLHSGSLIINIIIMIVDLMQHRLQLERCSNLCARI